MPELQVCRDFPELYENAGALSDNIYPGRIVLMGLSERGDVAIQAYAIMGRSTGSHSRIFVDEGLGSVRTTAPGKTPDEMAATKNAELIYYQAAKAGEGVYVISNGAQTVPVYESILQGNDLDVAVKSSPTVGGVDLSKYEPDDPNFTPRITGVIDLREEAATPFGLAVVTKEPASDEPVHTTYTASDIREVVPGVGFVVQTYFGEMLINSIEKQLDYLDTDYFSEGEVYAHNWPKYLKAGLLTIDEYKNLKNILYTKLAGIKSRFIENKDYEPLSAINEMIDQLDQVEANYAILE